MTKVAFLMQETPEVFGAERATVDLIKALRDQEGIVVHTLLIEEKRLQLQQSPLRALLGSANLPFSLLPTDKAFSTSLVRMIREHVRAGGAQILHAVGYKADLHGALAVRGMTGVRLVGTVHGWLFRPDPKERFYGWLDIQALKRCDRVITLSRFYEDMLATKGIARDRLVRIPSGVPLDQFPEPALAVRTLAQGDILTVGILGRLSSEKNHGMLLKAAQLVLAAGVNVRFLLAGEGPERNRIESLITSLGLGPHVEMPGYVDRDDFFTKVHVLAVTSRIENLPYSVLEAMGWCRPVIATRVGGLPDLVDDGRTGFLVEPDDFRSLAARIVELARNFDRLTDMGLAGRRKLEQEFDIARCAAAYRHLYEALSA